MVRDDSWKLFKNSKGFFYRFYDNTRNVLNKRLVKYILSFSRHEDLVVLEAGSGPGQGSVFMSKDNRVREAIALDHDQKALDSNSYKSEKFNKIVGDITKLPLKDKSVDVIWNSSTMEHLSNEDFVKGVDEFSRVLKDDGYVFVGVPYKQGLFAFFSIFGKGAKDWIGKLFSIKMLVNYFRNFKIVKVNKYLFNGFVGVVARK